MTRMKALVEFPVDDIEDFLRMWSAQSLDRDTWYLIDSSKRKHHVYDVIDYTDDLPSDVPSLEELGEEPSEESVDDIIDECMEEIDFEDEVFCEGRKIEEIKLAMRQILEMAVQYDDPEHLLPNIAGNLNRIEAISKGRVK